MKRLILLMFMVFSTYTYGFSTINFGEFADPITQDFEGIIGCCLWMHIQIFLMANQKPSSLLAKAWQYI